MKLLGRELSGSRSQSPAQGSALTSTTRALQVPTDGSIRRQKPKLPARWTIVHRCPTTIQTSFKVVIFLPSTFATTLGLDSFDGGHNLCSKRRCIRVRAYAYQLIMDATKALAQRLRRRNSRWRDKRGGASGASGAARSPAGKTPVAGAAGDPPASTPATAPETEKACTSSTAAPPRTNVETPSPLSDVSPRTQVPPKQVEIGKHDPEKDAEDPPAAEETADYFAMKPTEDSPIQDAPASSRITFAIPTKERKEDGRSDSSAEGDSSEDKAVPSAVPITVVRAGPYQQQQQEEDDDDDEEDVGHSSTVSVSGGGSRHSSIASVAFRLPDESLPQGRARRHRNSLPPLSR